MSAEKVSVARVQTQNREVNQLQQNLITGISQLQQQLIQTPSNGTFLDAALIAGDNVINHNLDTTPTGYIITNNDAASVIYRKEFAPATITLNSSVPVNVTIFLF